VNRKSGKNRNEPVGVYSFFAYDCGGGRRVYRPRTTVKGTGGRSRGRHPASRQIAPETIEDGTDPDPDDRPSRPCVASTKVRERTGKRYGGGHVRTRFIFRKMDRTGFLVFAVSVLWPFIRRLRTITNTTAKMYRNRIIFITL